MNVILEYLLIFEREDFTMVETQGPVEPATSHTLAESVRVQRSIATILAAPTLCLLIAGLVMGTEIIRGDFKNVQLFLVVAAFCFCCVAVSYSLFRGRGVPSWFLRALWIMSIAGVVYLAIPEMSKYLAGERVDLAGNLLVFGVLVYFCFSTFRDFWISKVKHPT